MPQDPTRSEGDIPPPRRKPGTFPSDAEAFLQELNLGTAPEAEDSTADRPGGQGRPDAVPPDYVIEKELGVGGMGVVYQARHVQLNRVIALKMIRGSGRPDPRTVIRFLAEAEAVAAVSHPNVVLMLEYGETAGRPFMVFEFCRGGTLAAKLKAADGAPVRLTPAVAAGLVAKLAGGVAAAHERGIVHRDLKPANVLFDDAGEPKVADFGIAKRASSDLTATQAVLGTPAYMSPEQAGGKAKFVGPQADVWALGVILFECLTGGRPFDGETASEVIASVISADPMPALLASPGTPRDLALICRKCLEKSPAARYPTGAELADDLNRYLAGRPISVRPVGWAERTTKWVRRNPAVTALLGAVALTTVGLIVSLAAQYRQAVAREAAEREGREAAERLVREKDQLVREKEAIALEEHNRRTEANAETARSNLVTDLLSDVFRSSDPLDLFGDTIVPPNWEKERNRTAEQILKDAVKSSLTKLQDPSLALVRAKLLSTVGNSLKGLGAFPDATAALREALALRQARLPATHPDVLKSELDLGRLEIDLGDNLSGIERFRRVHALQEQAGADEAVLLTTRLYEGTAAAVVPLPEAGTILREVVAGRERLFGPYAKETVLAKIALMTYYLEVGEGDTIGLTAEVLKGIEAQPSGQFRDVAEMTMRFQYGLALCHGAADGSGVPVAGVLLRPGLEAIRSSIERAERGLLPPDHILLTLMRFEYAKVLLKSGKADEADALFARVLVDVRKTTGLGHPKAANLQYVYGRRLADSNRVAEARALHLECVRANADRFGAVNPWRAIVLLHHAEFAALQRAEGEAVAAGTEAARLCESGNLIPNRATLVHLHNTALELGRDSPSPAAAALARRLYAVTEPHLARVFGENSPEVVVQSIHLADLVYRTGDRARGAAMWDAAEARAATLTRPLDTLHRYDLSVYRGDAAADRGRWADAEAAFRKAYKLAPDVANVGDDAPTNVARALTELGRFDEAVPFLERAQRAAVGLRRSEKDRASADLALALARLGANEADECAADVKAMLKRYGKSKDVNTLARLAWAVGISPSAVPPGELTAVTTQFQTALANNYPWGYRGLALLRLRAGDLAGVETALAKGGKAEPVSEVIRGLAAVSGGNDPAARACLHRAEAMIEAAKPSEKKPFAYAGTVWHFRLETSLLLAELRGKLIPTAPPPRPL